MFDLDERRRIENLKITTWMGFEPTRAEHIGLAVQRLNHSATASHIIYINDFFEFHNFCLTQGCNHYLSKYSPTLTALYQENKFLSV